LLGIIVTVLLEWETIIADTSVQTPLH
jgi:hypothetical protein